MKFTSCSTDAFFLGYNHKVFTDDKGNSTPYLMLDFYDNGRVLSLSADPRVFDSDSSLESLRFSDVIISCDFSRRYRNGGYVWVPRVVGMVAE